MKSFSEFWTSLEVEQKDFLKKKSSEILNKDLRDKIMKSVYNSELIVNLGLNSDTLLFLKLHGFVDKQDVIKYRFDNIKKLYLCKPHIQQELLIKIFKR